MGNVSLQNDWGKYEKSVKKSQLIVVYGRDEVIIAGKYDSVTFWSDYYRGKR